MFPYQNDKIIIILITINKTQLKRINHFAVNKPFLKRENKN